MALANARSPNSTPSSLISLAGLNSYLSSRVNPFSVSLLSMVK